MPNNKSPGKEGLKKSFAELFRKKKKKKPLHNCTTKSYQNEKLSTLQSQAVIKLIEKRIRTRT